MSTDFTTLVETLSSARGRSKRVIKDFARHLQGVRADAGASVRKGRVHTGGVRGVHTGGGKYHKHNTQYIGSSDALDAYAHFLDHAPDLVDDDTFLAHMACHTTTQCVLHVEGAIVACFNACKKCGKRCDVNLCDNCKMIHKAVCDTCHTVTDKRRMCGTTCDTCDLKTIVLCVQCCKRVPKGHPCKPAAPQCATHAVGRPRKYTHFDVNGKPHIRCTHGCKPNTYIGLNSWRRHLRRKHPEALGLGVRKLFRCRRKGCGYSCNDKNQFARHMLTHSKSRAFACRFCEKSYKQSEGLSAHRKKHHTREHTACTALLALAK